MFAYLKLAALVVFYLFSMMFVIPNTLTVKNDEMMLWGIAYMLFIFVPVTYIGAKFVIRQVEKLMTAFQDNRDKGLKDLGEDVETETDIVEIGRQDWNMLPTNKSDTMKL